MGNPNEPRLLTEPRPLPRAKDDHVTGNAGLDGFTRLAAARPMTRHQPIPGFGEYVAPGEIDPPVGQREYRSGSRYED